MEDGNWCLACNRRLEPGQESSPPLVAEDDVFHSSDDEEETLSPNKMAPLVAAPAAAHRSQLKTRHGTIKARPHAHPMRKNLSSGKLAQRSKLNLTSAVNTAVAQAQQRQKPPASDTAQQKEAPAKPDWAYLYCSEECMRVDEQRARLGLANLEPPKSPFFSPTTPTFSVKSGSAGSRPSSSRRGSMDHTTHSPTMGKIGSSSNLQALTPLAGSTPMRIRQRSHSPNSRSQSEDLGGSRSGSYDPTSYTRLSSSVKSTHSQPMVVGTLRPESMAFMRPASPMGRTPSNGAKSAATTGLTGTSVTTHMHEPPPSPALKAFRAPPTHRSSQSTSSVRLESDPESPSSIVSRSSASTAPSSARWAEEPPSLDLPHDMSKSPLHTGYGLYHRLPRRNASSSSLSRSPPTHLHITPVTGLTSLSQSYGPSSDHQSSSLISDVFRAGQARRTASSASIAAMNSEANASAVRRSRPPFLHMKHNSSGGASSDSSNDGANSPLPSPAMPTSAGGGSTRLWTNAQALQQGRRPSFVYEAFPEVSPSKPEMTRHNSENNVNKSGTVRRKRLFHFPNGEEER